MKRLLLAALALAIALPATTQQTLAQSWPTKPVRLIVPFGAGSTPDVMGRLLTDYLQTKGYQVLRFWDHEVLQETDTVLEAIYLALKETTPSPRATGSGRLDRAAIRRLSKSPQSSPPKGERGKQEGL